MESAVPVAAGNKLISDKNTLLAVLQLLRKYNLKVHYILGYETSIELPQTVIYRRR
jgi:hypothetical protein